MESDFSKILQAIEELSKLQHGDSFAAIVEKDCLGFASLLFRPSITDGESATRFFSDDEICNQISKVVDRIYKERYSSEPSHPIEVQMTSVKEMKHQYLSTIHILPYFLYLAKQQARVRQNCFNQVLVDEWNSPEAFCESLPLKLDFSLWTDDQQTDACMQAQKTTRDLIGNPLSQDNTACSDLDAEECDPCGKTLSHLFS